MLKIFLVLFSLIQAQWETPFLIDDEQLHTRTVYTDNSNGATHIAWCINPTLNFHYVRINPDKSITFNKHIPLKYPCLEDFAITGLGDGKHLYFVYRGKRDPSVIEGRCEDDPKYCRDVYFMESSDEGKTWSKPFAVPRKNMADKEERKFPKILVTQKGRIWIFYRMTGFYEAPVSYVSRAPGSTVFSMEVNLPIKADHLAITETIYKKVNRITLYYSSQDDYSHNRYYTETNGVKWIGPESIKEICNGDIIEYYPFYSNLFMSHLFAVCRDKDYNNYLRISSNAGSTWRTVKISENVVPNKFTIAKDSEGKGIIAYGIKTITYMYFNENKFHKYVNPPVSDFSECESLTFSIKNGKYNFLIVRSDPMNKDQLWAIQAKIGKYHMNTDDY